MRRAENASPMQAAEEPPNLKIRISVDASCRRIAWDLAGSAFKLWDFGQLVVEESEIAFARIKIDFVVRNTRWGIAPKYLTHEPRQV